MTVTLHVGAAMWNHPRWPVDGIAGYSTWCNAVEGNTTFYALPTPTIVRRWAAQTPDGFQFVFKLPQEITHRLRLRGCGDQVDGFLSLLSPLRAACGPLSVQLPASFGPEQLPVLAAFLRAASTEWDWAVEVRHPAFFDGGDDMGRLHELLSSHRVDKVLLDSRAVFAGPCETEAEQEAFRVKPRLPARPTVTAQRPIVRFIGQTDPDANPTFWKPWVERVAVWLNAGLRPIVFLHTPDNNAALDQARRFHASVVELVPSLAPLPKLARLFDAEAG